MNLLNSILVAQLTGRGQGDRTSSREGEREREREIGREGERANYYCAAILFCKRTISSVVVHA